MNSARQIIRWSLPGLVFVVNLLIFHGLWLGFVGHTSPWAFINEATAPALVAVVAGGLPGGFLIYQVYFHDYRPVGPVFFWRLPFLRFYRQDRGARVLSQYAEKYRGKYSLLVELDQRGTTRETLQERISLPVLKPYLFIFTRPHGDHLKVGTVAENHSKGAPWRCKECAKGYVERSDQNWILLQSAIDYCASAPDSRWIKHEYISGSDLYHGLGAARAAVWLAMLVSLVYDGLVKPFFVAAALPEAAAENWNFVFIVTTLLLPSIVAQTVSYVGVVIAILLIAGFEGYVLTRCRIQTALVYHARIAAALALVSRNFDKPSRRLRNLPWPFHNRDASAT